MSSPAELGRLRGSEPCVYNQVVNQISGLLNVLTQLREDLARTDKTVYLYHMPFTYVFGRVVDRSKDVITYPAGWWYSSRIVFNDNNIPLAGAAPGQLAALLLHELSHLYGTEDDYSQGPLMNAHEIERLFRQRFAGLSDYKYELLPKARAACGGGGG
jgi:hypothetical protein